MAARREPWRALPTGCVRRSSSNRRSRWPRSSIAVSSAATRRARSRRDAVEPPTELADRDLLARASQPTARARSAKAHRRRGGRLAGSLEDGSERPQDGRALRPGRAARGSWRQAHSGQRARRSGGRVSRAARARSCRARQGKASPGRGQTRPRGGRAAGHLPRYPRAAGSELTQRLAVRKRLAAQGGLGSEAD
jgi:hypothetical protein